MLHFYLGLTAGGFIGVAIMCVLQVGSRGDPDKEPVTRKKEME